jgi:uncharacterized protein (DUF362 family)
MIVTTDIDGIAKGLTQLGAPDALRPRGSAVIKINLARPPDPDRPRTHPDLIRAVVSFVRSHGASCAIAEGTNGFLKRNIECIGLADFVEENDVELIDLDLEEDVESIAVGGETHFIPRRLADFSCRIAIPATTWLPDMIFSNNVKLFVGAVPLRLYQEGARDSRSARWRVHIDLHKSVANIYRAVTQFCPFQFFVNGGTAATRSAGLFSLPRVHVGSDGLELDEELLTEIKAGRPEYLDILKNETPNQ